MLFGLQSSRGRPSIVCAIHCGYLGLGCFLLALAGACTILLGCFVFVGVVIVVIFCSVCCSLLSRPSASFLMLAIAPGLHPCIIRCLSMCSGLTVLNLCAILQNSLLPGLSPWCFFLHVSLLRAFMICQDLKATVRRLCFCSLCILLCWRRAHLLLSHICCVSFVICAFYMFPCCFLCAHSSGAALSCTVSCAACLCASVCHFMGRIFSRAFVKSSCSCSALNVGFLFRIYTWPFCQLSRPDVLLP